MDLYFFLCIIRIKHTGFICRPGPLLYMDMVVGGTRILTPGEVSQLREVIERPSDRVIFDALLFSGVRYAELSQVAKEPSRFNPERKCLTIDNKKSKAAERAGETRVVYLSDLGVLKIQAFIDLGKTPAHYNQWLRKLKRWSHVAGLKPLDGLVNGTTREQLVQEMVPNVWGISVKSTRKSWECFLFCSFPDRADVIADNMGHTVEVSKKHYRKWFGAFTAEEKAKILEYTAGWLA